MISTVILGGVDQTSYFLVTPVMTLELANGDRRGFVMEVIRPRIGFAPMSTTGGGRRICEGRRRPPKGSRCMATRTYSRIWPLAIKAIPSS